MPNDEHHPIRISVPDLLVPRPMHEAIQEFKRVFIDHVLRESGSVQKKAAETLQIQATYLNRLVKDLGIPTKRKVDREDGSATDLLHE